MHEDHADYTWMREQEKIDQLSSFPLDHYDPQRLRTAKDAKAKQKAAAKAKRDAA